MMKSITLAILVLLFGPGLRQAQKSDPCKGETTYEMKQCSAKKFKQADDELNITYKKLMSKLGDEGHKATLKTAQQAWLKYRDSNCDFESYLNRGGSIYSVIVTYCMTSMTNLRTKELKDEIKELDEN